MIPVLILGFSLGVISIWPGIISGNSRKCFFNILKDGSDGSVKVSTILSIIYFKENIFKVIELNRKLVVNVLM